MRAMASHPTTAGDSVDETPTCIGVIRLLRMHQPQEHWITTAVFEGMAQLDGGEVTPAAHAEGLPIGLSTGPGRRVDRAEGRKNVLHRDIIEEHLRNDRSPSV
jgi:hypothetical protein